MTGARETLRAGLPTVREWVDVAVVIVLAVLAVIGLEPAYGTASFLLPALGGLAVGTVAALAARILRLGALTTALLGVVAYFLFGSALAMPGQAIGGVLPNLDTLAGLVTGAVFGWGDALTLRTPLELPAYITVVPYVAAWLVALVGTSLVTRWLPSRRSPLAASAVLVPALVLFVTVILLGTREPMLAGVRGVLFAAIALTWLGGQRGRKSIETGGEGTGRLRRRLVGAGIVVIGSVLVGALAGAALTTVPESRYVMREQVTPPFDPLSYPSPLAGFRKYTKDLRKTKLFTVTGVKKGTRIRMATMDRYNGVVWNVSDSRGGAAGSGSFELLGREIPKPPLFTPGGRAQATIDVEHYDDVWLPQLGFARTLDFDASPDGGDPAEAVRVNAATGTTALMTGTDKGLEYTVGAVAQKEPGDKQLAHVPAAQVAMPPIENVPDVVTAKAKEYAGTATTAIQKLRNIERSLKTFGYLSHGRASDPVPARAGEGADRMIQLLSQDPMVGDQEQYATAFALMAHSLGYPVRVVMGFTTPAASDGTATVTGDDVTAWVEVPFQGVGWVPFDPTPTKTDAPKQQTTQPKKEPQPQVRQPPRTNPKQDQLLTPVKTKDSEKKHKHKKQPFPVWMLVTGGAILLPVALYFLALLILVLLKRRRRRKRTGSGPPDRRAAGAWEEMLDGFSELGFVLPAPATRLQTAGALQGQAEEQGLAADAGTLNDLASRVDRSVFAAETAAESAVDGFWKEIDALLHRLRSRAGWLRRRLSEFRYARRRGPRL